MTTTATIRRVWPPAKAGEKFTVILEPTRQLDRVVTWTHDAWLASLAERYCVYTGRPVVTVQYDWKSHELQGVALPVAEETT